MKLSFVFLMVVGCLPDTRGVTNPPVVWEDNDRPDTRRERETAICTTLRNTLFHLLTVMSNRSAMARAILQEKAKMCFPGRTTGRPLPTGSDPCTSYSAIDDADRAVTFNQDTGKCDSNDLLAGSWYRITGEAGSKLGQRNRSSACSSTPTCGTSIPGFMLGSNPKKVGKTVKRSVCFPEGNNCCRYRVKIRVLRCPGNFLVYQLPPVPKCNARYCGNQIKTGEDKDHPGTSCKAIRDENPERSSGLYWIKLAVGEAFQVYCDQETDGGGWTLVYSYRFINYPNFLSGTNAVTPRPSWPAMGDVPESRTVPLNETQGGAMNFSLWKQIGHEFMAKSNINHWIVCEEGSGSLVEYRAGTLSCSVVKNIGTKCLNVAPDELRVLTKEADGNYGPHLYNSKSSTWLKTYYYWESSTQSRNWPTHDPCGRNRLSHVKNVPDPHGNIYIR